MHELGIGHDFRDTGKDPPSRAELDRLLRGDVRRFLSPRSGPYRELGLKDRTVGKAEAIRLIARDVNLLRRPLLVAGRRVIVGLDEDAYRAL